MADAPCLELDLNIPQNVSEKGHRCMKAKLLAHPEKTTHV